MNRVLVAFCAFLALSWCSPAAAAAFANVVTPSTAFSASQSTPMTVTANGNCSAGSQLIAIATSNSTTGTLALSDTLTDSFTLDKAWTLNTHRQNAWHVTLSSPVVSAVTTFTVTPTVTGRMSLIIICVSGADTLDVIGTGVANGAGTSSTTTQTPGSVASTINIAWIWRNGAPTAFSEDTGHGWAATVQTVNNTSNNILTLTYQITTATTALTYAPTWTGSVTSESATISYKGAAVGGTCLLSLLGVGSC